MHHPIISPYIEFPTLHFIKLQQFNINKLIPMIYSNVHGKLFNPIEKINWVLNYRLPFINIIDNKIKLSHNYYKLANAQCKSGKTDKAL